MSSVACRVCLRTNAQTQDLPHQLKTFHDELCDFETVQHNSLKYCASCAHQIKKFYKFKGQCLRANGLLKLWIKHEKKDISEYHKELPSPSLQITNNSTSFVFECEHDENILHNTNVTSDCNRNLVLKLNRCALTADDRMHPESSEVSLNSNSNVPDRPNPVIRPDVRHSPGPRPALRPNISFKPAFTLNSGLRPGFSPNFGIRSDFRPKLKTELVKVENGILTIDPNLLSMQSRPVIRPNLGLRPALRPDLSLRPAIRPNPGLGLSIQLPVAAPSGQKQTKQTDLTFDTDFDVSYEIDPLSVVNNESSMDVDKNSMDINKSTMNIVENTMYIIEKETVVEMEKHEVDIDDKNIDIDDAIASVIEIEQKEVDNNEFTIDSTIPKEGKLYDNVSMANKNEEKLYDNESMDNKNEEKLYDSESMDNSKDNNEELINNENDMDNDIDSDEYIYEYLEEDIDLLDFRIEPKREETSEAASIEKKQAIKITVKEPKMIILKVEGAITNVPQPALNKTNIPLEDKSIRITKKYVKKAKVTQNPEHTNRSPGFKAVPTFKAKMFGLFEESPFVLEGDTVLTKELFSVIYDKFNVRELKRIAVIILKGNFRPKLTAYLGVLYRKYNPEYESIFHVEYLHTEEKKKEEFKRRESLPDYIRAAYKCDLCYRTYTGQSFLDYHKKIYHDPAAPHVCSICSYSMPTRARLIKHRFQNHQAAFACKLCPLRTNLVTVMRNHYNSHIGAQYQCAICFKVFYNANTLSNHKRRLHATHVCPTCAQQYTTEKGLRIHRETQHKDAPPPEPAQAVPCAVCDVTFDTPQSYQRHCLHAHTPLAEQRFPRRKRVKRPPAEPTAPKVRKKEIGEKQIMEQKEIEKVKEKKIKRVYRTCEVCHEKVHVEKFGGFLYKHFLDKHPGVPYHAQGMQPKDYLCDECGKPFYCQATLRDHKNRHTGLRPYMCEMCPARFHTKTRLWWHRGKHCERSHRCEECGKLFKNATHLWTHMRIHIGDRRFKCHICHKGFLHNSSLKEHVKGVHYKERRVKKAKQAQEISVLFTSYS